MGNGSKVKHWAHFPKKKRWYYKIRLFALRFATPIFMLLLLVAFFFYYADIFAGATWSTYLLAYGGTAAYIGLVFFLSDKRRKRKLAENNHLPDL